MIIHTIYPHKTNDNQFYKYQQIVLSSPYKCNKIVDIKKTTHCLVYILHANQVASWNQATLNPIL
jgi:hypothetical protein